MKKQKAYEVTVKSWPDIRIIMAARTPGQARGRAWRDSQDTGYKIPFTDFLVKRSPLHDKLAERPGASFPWVIGWEDKKEDFGFGCLAKAETS